MDLLEIYNDDCFNVFSKMKDKSVDLFVLDLPYANKKFGNCVSCAWDTPIDLAKMWVEIKRIMKPTAVLCFFCNTKFGFTLIESNPKWFRYDLIWKKSRKVGFLSANKRQLRNHENIYIFQDKPDETTYNPQKEKGLPYKRLFKKGEETTCSLYDTARTDTINEGDRHPASIIENQMVEEHENVYVFGDKEGTFNPQKVAGGRPHVRKQSGHDIDNIYNQKNFKPSPNPDGNMFPCSVIEHENVYVFGEKEGTYNPQKTEGKPYKCGGRKSMGYYGDCGDKYINTGERVYDGARHPTSILDFKSVHKTIHRTEKPVGILEYLIKSYSNEGDTVMDFTMGSGSCGEACFNTKRRFIGVEKDDDIFVLAQERLSKLDNM